MPPAPPPPLADGQRGRAIGEADRRFIRVFVGTHRRILAASGGRILGRLGGHPLIILTTTGRKTGRPHGTPVIGIPDGPNWLVVASNGGAATQPLWVRNIAACPEVTVRRGKRTAAFRARILPDRERASCWPKLSGAYPAYDKMQAKTDRPLPVIALENVP
jgi:deazaflavin-dependent oxidoreductase (nitroreductase family)